MSRAGVLQSAADPNSIVRQVLSDVVDHQVPEHRSNRLACAAHIFGGTVPEFRALAQACANWTLTDRQAGIKAVWDDESYLQRSASLLMATLVRWHTETPADSWSLVGVL